MKRVLLGSVPILAVLALLINFMGDGVPTAQAVVAFEVQKPNPVPGVDNGDMRDTEWANFGTVLTVTVTDSDYAAGGSRDGGPGDLADIRVESDEFDTEDLLFDAVVEAADTGVFTATFVIDENETALIGDIVTGATCPSVGGIGTAATANCVHTDDDDFILIIFETNANVELRSFQVDIENEIPDIRGLEPEHDSVVDDSRVDIAAEITDADSGIPTPEDLPDGDTDDEYTTILFLRSTEGQCLDETTGPRDGLLRSAPNVRTTVAEIIAADCNGDGDADIELLEVASEDDFDDIDDGFAVDTRFTLADGANYITVLAFDAAGNYRVLDVDRSDEDVVMAKITVDEQEPAIDVARTGVTWDSADDKYDDARDYIQIVFDDATDLDSNSIQRTDVIVEGHDVRRVQWFDLDPEEIDGGPGSSGAPHAWKDRPEDFDGTKFVPTGAECKVTAASLADHAGGVGAETFVTDVNGDGIVNVNDVVIQAFCQDDDLFVDGDYDYTVANRNAFIRRSVFVQLEDELQPDETPDVNVVPNGIDDEAGNTLDGGNDAETEAEDWISPEFTVLEISGPISGKLLAGEDDEMELIITSDEDLDDDPTVTVTLVDAPAGCEIGGAGADACGFNNDDQPNPDVDEIGRNRWRVVIGDPDATGYYNIYIEGEDQEGNNGDTGIAPADIADDFFKDNGDVNDDDAIFFEGDIELPAPRIIIAGEEDPSEYEDEVEIRSPFFIELNFERAEFDADDNPAGAAFDDLNENNEYLKDSFDDVEITLFELDGVDMTDQVKSTDKRRFLIAIDNIELGDHTITIEARDEAGNEFDDDVEADFVVEERATFDLEVRPGWNLVSVPGAPADPAIDAVFGPGVPVTTIYTFDPTVPGGWLVAVRETEDDPWVGDLAEIDPTRGYWTLSNSIFEVNVNVPRIVGGAADSGTPVQPPTVDLFPGWNLVPIIDVTGEAEFEDTVDADIYFGSVDDIVKQIVTFNTITNVWETVPFSETDRDNDPGDTDGDATTPDTLDDEDVEYGRAYWVFANEAATLVPGGN